LYFRCDARYGCVGHGMYHFFIRKLNILSLISSSNIVSINE